MITREIVIPQWVKVEEGTTDHARFSIEPFERGYGTTVGNSLRRVLLASLEGAAVTAIRVEGVHHEFSTIPGVKEDVTGVVLNFKKCQLRLNRPEPIIFTFHYKGQGEVTAAEVFKERDIDVFNPELVIFTSTTKTTAVNMEIKVAHGRGYITADQFELQHAPLGTIYLDACFSPVTKVNFQVEDARVGQTTDYDRLLLEVWTNGSITPQDALHEAANLLINHLKIFVNLQTPSAETPGRLSPEDPELKRTLARSVDELELSVRSANCLKAANIRTIGALVAYDEAAMLQFHNFGKKSLDEIKALLDGLGLELGMNVGAPPQTDSSESASDSDSGSDSDDEANEDENNE